MKYLLLIISHLYIYKNIGMVHTLLYMLLIMVLVIPHIGMRNIVYQKIVSKKMRVLMLLLT